MQQRIKNIQDQIWHQRLRRPYRLHTVDHGGQGPVVILLHGLAASSSNWQELVDLLKPDFRCISVDLLGFGESSKPEWAAYSMTDHVRSIDYTIRRLALKDPYILIGHSLGSLLATRYAAGHGTNISRLILLSPPIYLSPASITKRIARRRTTLYLQAYKFLRTHPRVTPENVIRLKRLVPQARYLDLRPDTWTAFVRSLEYCIEQQTMEEDIRHVDRPIDLFYGKFDEVVVPHNIKSLSAGNLTIHTPNASHAIGKRYAAAVAKVITTQAKPTTGR